MVSEKLDRWTGDLLAKWRTLLNPAGTVGKDYLQQQ